MQYTAELKHKCLLASLESSEHTDLIQCGQSTCPVLVVAHVRTNTVQQIYQGCI